MPDLERFLPNPDESVAEHTVVSADPSRTYAAIGRTDASGNRLLGPLGGLAGFLDSVARSAPRPRTLDELLGPELGFVRLADEASAARVSGLVLRYSAFDRGVERLELEQFASFAEPGHLKAVVAFSLHPQESGQTLLTCDVRVRATDDDTRSTLHTTWFAVGAGLRLLVRRLLELIRAEAERGAGSDSQA